MGMRALVRSSTAKRFRPPLTSSLKRSCQSTLGKPAAALVSSMRMRLLFCLPSKFSKPKISLLTQSKPTQAEPTTIRSSLMKKSSGWGGAGASPDEAARVGRVPRASCSVGSGRLGTPPRTLKCPDWTAAALVAAPPPISPASRWRTAGFRRTS